MKLSETIKKYEAMLDKAMSQSANAKTSVNAFQETVDNNLERGEDLSAEGLEARETLNEYKAEEAKHIHAVHILVQVIIDLKTLNR